MNSVIAAYAAAWLICMIYVGTLWSRQRQLRVGLNSLLGRRPDEGTGARRG